MKIMTTTLAGVIQTLFNLLVIFPQELKQYFDFAYKDLIVLIGNIDLFGYYIPCG
jgi:hypothetical protein